MQLIYFFKTVCQQIQMNRTFLSTLADFHSQHNIRKKELYYNCFKLQFILTHPPHSIHSVAKLKKKMSINKSVWCCSDLSAQFVKKKKKKGDTVANEGLICHHLFSSKITYMKQNSDLQGCSRSNASNFIMFAYNIRGRYCWCGSRG